MAFESINVSNLRNALNTCKNNINNNVSKDLINISNDVWQTDAKKNLRDALRKLNNIQYKELTDKIDKYLSVTSDIQEYKNLQNTNKNLQAQYNSLSTRLWRTETYTEEWYDYNAKQTKSETKTRTVKDSGVESQMNQISRMISDNNAKMESLKNKILSSV